MKILVINAGSSSLKYQFIDMDSLSVIAKGICERIGIEGSCIKHTPGERDAVILNKEMKNHTDALNMLIDALVHKEHGVITDLGEITAVGHRVVHGGEFFAESVLIDENVKKTIEECIPLAPLHNPPNLTGILACEKVIPNAPQVAVFDTAFHQTMPPEAFMYAIPYKYYRDYKIRRYGFHGTSHKYVAMRAAELMGKPLEELKLITLHLGNGSSIAAIKNGRSIDTSMGFTPLSGLLMGTRSGDIDPAILTFIAEKESLSPEEVNNILNKESGVLGISGVSSDFRDLESNSSTNEFADLALRMFNYSVKKHVGQYSAVLNGVDAIVFTAGIGENNSKMRSQIASGLKYLGVKLDEEKNLVRGKDIDVSAEGSTVKTLVIPTNEELMIALDTKKIVTDTLE